MTKYSRREEICKDAFKLNNLSLEKIKLRIEKISSNKNVYFKDEISNGKRKLCFRGKPYDKDLVNPYSTNPTTIGLRKLGNQVLGIGVLK